MRSYPSKQQRLDGDGANTAPAWGQTARGVDRSALRSGRLSGRRVKQCGVFLTQACFRILKQRGLAGSGSCLPSGHGSDPYQNAVFSFDMQLQK